MVQDAMTEYQGPWWAEGQVLDLLQVDEVDLAKARAQRRVVGVQFNDGLFYYPARQFVLKPRKGVLAGLKPVLDVLATGIDDPETWITWLAGRYGWREEDTETMWDLLREGRTADVLETAKHDAWSWSN